MTRTTSIILGFSREEPRQLGLSRLKPVCHSSALCPALTCTHAYGAKIMQRDPARKARAMEAPAGSILMYHSGTWHRIAVNSSAAPRVGVAQVGPSCGGPNCRRARQQQTPLQRTHRKMPAFPPV